MKEVVAVMGETEHVVVAMASCHSINIVDGDLMGDPLDLKMFEASNWVCGVAWRGVVWCSVVWRGVVWHSVA